MSLEGSQPGRYQLSHILGSGSMGEVYLAEDSGIRRQVAIKVVRSEPFHYLNEENARLAKQLFEQEMRVIARLDHPHILPLYDYGDSRVNGSTVTYMVMPYRPEGSLLVWLRQQHDHGRRLSLPEVVSLIEQAASAIAHAHERQVIHQDVKPSNFLIRVRPEAPDHPDLLLTDFGISRFATVLTQSNQFVQGTPIYMAPEHWKGHPTYASDQYSLAVMAYELIVGRPPFEGRHEQIMYGHLSKMPAAPSSLNKVLPPAVDAVLLRALEKQPEKRFASVTAFAEALLQACAHESEPITVSVNDSKWPPAVNRQPELAQGGRFAHTEEAPVYGPSSVSSARPAFVSPPQAVHRLATARQHETGQPVPQFTESASERDIATTRFGYEYGGIVCYILTA
jgi:serine/threonine protein kinase